MRQRRFSKTERSIFCLALVFAAAEALLVGPSQAHAQSVLPTYVQVTPAIQEREVAAGEAANFELEITNQSELPLGYRLEIVEYTTDENGLPAYNLQEPAPFAAWLNLSQSDVLAQARASARLNLTARVPADAPAGSYIGAVVFSPVAPDGYFLPQSVKFTPRVAAVFALNVSRPDLNSTKLEDSFADIRIDSPAVIWDRRPDLRVSLSNSSPFYMRLSHKLSLTPLFGPPVETMESLPDTVLQAEDYAQSIRPDKDLPLGRYLLALRLTDTVTGTSYTYSQTIWVLPWWEILLWALITALSATLISLVFYKRRNLRAFVRELFIKRR